MERFFCPCFKTSSNGFYVHAPKIKSRDIKSTVKYVVRYYGLYAKKHKFSDKFNYMLKPHVAEFRKQLKNWRCRIELYFKHDPLKCTCAHTFHFDYLVQKSYNTS